MAMHLVVAFASAALFSTTALDVSTSETAWDSNVMIALERAPPDPWDRPRPPSLLGVRDFLRPPRIFEDKIVVPGTVTMAVEAHRREGAAQRDRERALLATSPFARHRAMPRERASHRRGDD